MIDDVENDCIPVSPTFFLQVVQRFFFGFLLSLSGDSESELVALVVAAGKKQQFCYTR
jgi:hypothetical protein